MKHFDTEAGAKLRAFLDSQEVKDAISGIEKAADSDSGTFEVVITTENLDRYNEVIKLDGWELEHYRKNPVVLWGHDHKLLIGMATSLEVVDGKMIAKGKFAPNALGQEVRALYDAGFLKATSVGFIEKEREGNLITQAELIEFSFVSVPANPYALSLAMEKELNLNELVTKGFMDIKEAETVVAEKGAIQEQQEAVEDRQKKWENFEKVDNLICAFWGVYFDGNTPVDDFTKLCAETAELLKKIASGEKAATLAGVDIKEGGMREVRERVNVIRALDAEGVKGLFIALEALSIEEPEREDTTDEEGEDETDEERGMREFADHRKLVQQLATLTSEVLADSRKYITKQ